MRVLKFLDRISEFRRLIRARDRRNSIGLSMSDLYENRMGFHELRFAFRVTRRLHMRNVKFRATVYINQTPFGAYWARWERGAVVASGPMSTSNNMIVQFDQFHKISGLNK